MKRTRAIRGCCFTLFKDVRWKSGRGCKENPLTSSSHASAEISFQPRQKRTMSLSTFQLMQTLKNSPAASRTGPGRHQPLARRYCEWEETEQRSRSGGAPRYVEVKELSTGRQLTKTYLQDIAYCAADANRPNVFLYICKHHGQQLQCRVFWCSRAERARDMTACLAHSFQRALSDWQQDGSATLTAGEVKGKRAEETSNSPVNTKSSTLPASLGKVRWKKRDSVSRSPLRAITRRGSSSNNWN
ncbi:hypothetical protein Q5P01_002607 [Channa striata]|uniref:PID domain-containing protein n=1 Tax=Channa striata TaxID=64152 RepID=A0AA88T887_CHASR|nr:hypothetical protein Q5P01_002607 [Channa striata]